MKKTERPRNIGQGLPLGVRLESASPAEVTLAEATLAEPRVPRPEGRPRQKLQRVIAHAGYDSDSLRKRLNKRAIELIAPYGRTSDGVTKIDTKFGNTHGSGLWNEPIPG